jgi:tRNA-uridine 2-sulfurtransferase
MADKPDRAVVAVGMSGGVDSTIAAFLLQRQGFTVKGLTMKIWDESLHCESRRSGCYGPGEAGDIADAAGAAERLGIEHHVIDLTGEYRETVIDYFRDEYLRGRTPNPCVVCNARIKFGALLERALSSGVGFDFFATGHYTRVEFDLSAGRYLLKRGTDAAKDQSYFLYRLSQAQLSKIIFPLGARRKEEVREIAGTEGFAEYLKKPESQDFLEWDDYGALLPGRVGPGNIRDVDGTIVGTHRGIAFYTVGQRKMLNLAGMKEPSYVLRIDAERNEIIAGPKRYLMKQGLVAGDLHWIVPPEALPPTGLSAQIRYRGVPGECTIHPMPHEEVRVEFVKPQEAVTPGQSVVFYAGDTVAGGGTIKTAT